MLPTVELPSGATFPEGPFMPFVPAEPWVLGRFSCPLLPALGCTMLAWLGCPVLPEMGCPLDPAAAGCMEELHEAPLHPVTTGGCCGCCWLAASHTSSTLVPNACLYCSWHCQRHQSRSQAPSKCMHVSQMNSTACIALFRRPCTLRILFVTYQESGRLQWMAR